MSGSTARLAWAPNRTLAMGSPAARLFFDPANWMAIRSSRVKPRRLAPYQVTASITARMTASTAISPPRRGRLIRRQIPATMPALKAV